MEQFKGRVLSIEDYCIKGRVEAQVMRIEKKGGFIFKPGQFVMLSEEGFRLRGKPDQIKWTSYSITSSPLDEHLEFIYTVRHTGGFTQHMAENLKVGSELGVKGPYGSFVLEDDSKDKVFVATGAGIAPIMSMLRTLKELGRAELFYGFRTGEHFLYRKVLESMAGKGLKLNTIISRDDPSWKGERGHVQKIVMENMFNPVKQDIYLCGNPQMVADMREFFLDIGFSEDQVRREQW